MRLIIYLLMSLGIGKTSLTPRYINERVKLLITVLDNLNVEYDKKTLIFVKWRIVAGILSDLLESYFPIKYKAGYIIGSGGIGKMKLAGKGALEVLEDFRNGTKNLIVSTSAGEEGSYFS